MKCIESKDIIRYNPYFDSLQYSLQDCDKPYLQNQISRYSLEALSPLNAILENCTNKSIEQFKCLENSSPKDQEVQNSILCQFLNIDGNLKNFDTLATTLKSIGQTFSIIALAETNIDPEVRKPSIFQTMHQLTKEKKHAKPKAVDWGSAFINV